MSQIYNLHFCWPEGVQSERLEPYAFQAENRGEAMHTAEQYWHSQEFKELPVGYDLFDQRGIAVLHFRPDRRSRMAA